MVALIVLMSSAGISETVFARTPICSSTFSRRLTKSASFFSSAADSSEPLAMEATTMHSPSERRRIAQEAGIVKFGHRGRKKGGTTALGAVHCKAPGAIGVLGWVPIPCFTQLAHLRFSPDQCDFQRGRCSCCLACSRSTWQTLRSSWCAATNARSAEGWRVSMIDHSST
jgi:hypothetical protein